MTSARYCLWFTFAGMAAIVAAGVLAFAVGMMRETD